MALKNLRNLKCLELRANQISEIPMWFINLKLLKKLDLSINKIKHIPTFFSELKELEFISFGANPIGNFPYFFLNLPNIKKIFVLTNTNIKLTNELEKLLNEKNYRVSAGCIQKNK